MSSLPPNSPWAGHSAVIAVYQDKQEKEEESTVLAEEVYTLAVSRIIERDFFPNLLKMREQNNALERYRFTEDYSKRLPTERLQDFKEQLEMLPPQSMAEDELLKNVDLSLSLDEFQQKYTSEDNASFGEIVQVANRRHRERYHWLYDTETKLIEGKEPLLIEGTWGYTARNTLMYGPEGINQKLEIMRSKPKAIVNANTRMETSNIKENSLALSVPPSTTDGNFISNI